MMGPITKEWEDLRRQSFQDEDETDADSLRVLRAVFFAGATAVLADIVKVVEDEDAMALVNYIRAGMEDVQQMTVAERRTL